MLILKNTNGLLNYSTTSDDIIIYFKIYKNHMSTLSIYYSFLYYI